MREDEVWDSALDAVGEQLALIETSVHGPMPSSTWLEVVRMHVDLLRKQPEVDVDQERLAALEDDMAMLKQAMADLHQAIADGTSHKNMQANVAELAKPEPEA